MFLIWGLNQKAGKEWIRELVQKASHVQQRVVPRNTRITFTITDSRLLFTETCVCKNKNKYNTFWPKCFLLHEKLICRTPGKSSKGAPTAQHPKLCSLPPYNCHSIFVLPRCSNKHCPLQTIFGPSICKFLSICCIPMPYQMHCTLSHQPAVP